MQKVEINDMMQKGYHYTRVARIGRDFDSRFTPDLTPEEMLSMGVFGGIYMRDCRAEFPRTWFTGAKFAPPDIHTPNPSLNYFGVSASQPLSVWRKKGWLYKDDPRGWFQWYCRYYMGRRIEEEDDRQIKRWRMMQRHVAQIKYHCIAGDESCRRKQRQALLQWGYDSRRF